MRPKFDALAATFLRSVNSRDALKHLTDLLDDAYDRGFGDALDMAADRLEAVLAKAPDIPEETDQLIAQRMIERLRAEQDQLPPPDDELDDPSDSLVFRRHVEIEVLIERLEKYLTDPKGGSDA